MEPERLKDVSEASSNSDQCSAKDEQPEATNFDQCDVAYSFYQSPIGLLLLATTAQGLVKIVFAPEATAKTLDELATKVGPRILQAPALLDQAQDQLEEYFSGTRTNFDLPLDLQLSHGFRRQAVEQMMHIPYGHTQTYSQIATNLNNPKAVRAVGSACATNPLPIIIPCHRVLKSDGGIGGYLAGLDAKTSLLNMEKKNLGKRS